MNFAKRLYLTAGVYGLLVLAPQYFLEARTGRDYPPAITHPEFYYGFIGAGVAWQILFLVIAGDPARYRTAMIPAVVEKATFGIAVILLYARQRIPVFVLGFGIIDLIFGALFIVAYSKTSPEARTKAAP